MSISEAAFQKLNASRYAIKVPSEAGTGRMAAFEAVHQIHCVVSPLRYLCIEAADRS